MRSRLFTSLALALAAQGCGTGEDLPFGNGGLSGGGDDDPCDEERSGDRRAGIMPGMCPGTSTACTDPQAPIGCNVRPPASPCTSPPGAATVLEVCPACTYTTITAAVAAIANPPTAETWVVVHAGTFTENVTVSQAGTAANPIKIAARCSGGSRDAVTVGFSTDNPVLKTTSTGTYVTFDGFKVNASAVAATEGAVALVGNNGTAKYIVVDGATNQAGFYVEGTDCDFEEIDATDSKYGFQATFGDNLDLLRGAFCASLENGMQLEGGIGHEITATLVQDSAVSGLLFDIEDDVVLKRVVSRGHTQSTGAGLELWDVTGIDVWHSQFVANDHGLLVDLGAVDMVFENVLFARNDRGITVSTGYTGSDLLNIRYSTFADGTYGVFTDADIDLRLRRNIFHAGSVPGGFGVDVDTAGATVGEELENLFSGYTTAANKCVDGGSGECSGVVWSSAEARMLGNGYYLEQAQSAGVDAASDNANTVTLGDGTDLEDLTTALDLVTDSQEADLGFHHLPCNETLGDEGCGDGNCSGTETSGSCPEDCP